MSDQTPEPYTPTLTELRLRYSAGSNLSRETLEQHYMGHPSTDYEAEFDRALAAHDREVAARAQAEIAKALDRLRVPEYCVTGDQKEAYRWALNRAHATARDYEKAGESHE